MAADKLNIDIELADGKYRVVMGDDYYLKALRYGEHWRDLVGDNLVYNMACEIQQLRQQIEDAKNCLVCCAIGDPSEVCENTYKILGGT